MKLVLMLSLALSFAQVSFAASETQATSDLLTSESPMLSEAKGGCEKYLPCSDGVHTAYCRATGPHTSCSNWGPNGVRCVAWNNSGQSTVATQSCP